jgi:hypothetical protein
MIWCAAHLVCSHFKGMATNQIIRNYTAGPSHCHMPENLNLYRAIWTLEWKRCLKLTESVILIVVWDVCSPAMFVKTATCKGHLEHKRTVLRTAPQNCAASSTSELCCAQHNRTVLRAAKLVGLWTATAQWPNLAVKPRLQLATQHAAANVEHSSTTATWHCCTNWDHASWKLNSATW